MSAQLKRPDRPSFASWDWFDGTAEEYREGASTYIAYSGPFHVNEYKCTLTQDHPWLIGGSAEPSTKTRLNFEGAGDINRDSFGGRNIHFGVREHAMGAILNGVALAAKLRVFESGFLIFSDDRRGSLRCRRSWKFQ